MSLFSRLKEYKDTTIKEIKSGYNEQQKEKAMLKQVYKDELLKAKISNVKSKARAKKSFIRQEARKDAQAGGKFRRVMKETAEAIKKKREQNNNSGRDNTPAMFR